MADYRPLARQAARRYGIPQNIFLALVNQESGWDPTAGSNMGAVGLTQIHLKSHPDVTYEQATNPRFALNWGARYLRAQYDRFGSWNLALAAYNAGPGAVDSGAWRGYGETTAYVRNILKAAGNGSYDTPAAATAEPPFDTATETKPGFQEQASPDLSGAVLANLAAAGTKDFNPVAQLSDLAMSVAQQHATPLTPATTQPDIDPTTAAAAGMP